MATDEDFLGPVRMPFFNNAESVYINGQEVQSIVVKDTGGILFQKSNDIENLPVMTLTVTGSSFETNSFTPFTYTGEVSVDWGDDTGLVEYTGGKLSHTFTDELNSHTVRVYGDITSLGYSCFASCTGLISVEIPSSVTTLGEACFGDCDKLTSIAIPSSVTSLGESCFAFCTSLTSITLPNSITSLENSCFESSGLTSITLPDSITRLGDGCFVECLNLISVDIPDSVMVLGGSCFYHCIFLTNYILNWTSSSTIITYDSTDMPNNTNTIFHIPYGTTQLYIDKGYPSNKLEEEIPFNNIVLSTDKSTLSSYHNDDSCTLTAQLMHNNIPINLAGVTVTFSVLDSLGERHELDTVQTNASGIATMTYLATNIEHEDIIATAEGFDSDICVIEKCFYALNQQYDITRNGTTVITKLNNDIITDLPSTYEIEFDMKSSNNPTSNEQRIYWGPNDLWTGTGQPSFAVFAGYSYPSNLEVGRITNGQTSETNLKIVSPGEWSHITIRRTDVSYYIFCNEEMDRYDTWGLSDENYYTDWIFGIILWSDTTFSIKNLKIKSTVPKNIIKPDDDDLEGAHIIP